MLCPKISILIPCYNSEKFIKRCVESCLHQTYRNFEIIIVNDGSSDSSPCIIDEMCKSYAFIKVSHQENKGISKTRNILLDLMNSEYGYFVDSDDWIEIDTLQKFVDKLGDDKQCNMIIGKCIIHRKNSAKGYYVTNKFHSHTTKNEFLINNILYPWNILFKRTLIGEKIRFCEESSFLEDAGMIPYAIYKSTNLKFLDYCSYNYIVISDSLTHSKITEEKIKSALVQIQHLYNSFRKEFIDGIPKYINDQFAFYHCVLFTYVAFQSELKHRTKKNLKTSIKNLEKNNWKLKIPRRYWKFWYFILYRLFMY